MTQAGKLCSAFSLRGAFVDLGPRNKYRVLWVCFFSASSETGSYWRKDTTDYLCSHHIAVATIHISCVVYRNK